MAQAHSFVNPGIMQANSVNAHQIPALTHTEAGEIARRELDRFLDVVDSLSGDDWQQPTDCTKWSVRDMLAHQAGAYAGYASWSEFRRQGQAQPQGEELKVDAMNRTQLADRADKSPAELIAELREVGPKAIRTRQRLPWLLRKLRVPMGPPIGWAPIEYLTDLIYPRDTWMHRVDICRATGQKFVQTAAHDGRVVALVVRELAQKLQKELGNKSIHLALSGEAGGRYRLGQAGDPQAIIHMDVLEFNRLASDRITAAEAKRHPQFRIEGDSDTADWLLARTSILY